MGTSAKITGRPGSADLEVDTPRIRIMTVLVNRTSEMFPFDGTIDALMRIIDLIMENGKIEMGSGIGPP